MSALTSHVNSTLLEMGYTHLGPLGQYGEHYTHPHLDLKIRVDSRGYDLTLVSKDTMEEAEGFAPTFIEAYFWAAHSLLSQVLTPPDQDHT